MEFKTDIVNGGRVKRSVDRWSDRFRTVHLIA